MINYFKRKRCYIRIANVMFFSPNFVMLLKATIIHKTKFGYKRYKRKFKKKNIFLYFFGYMLKLKI
jgi:hypothetical protein